MDKNAQLILNYRRLRHIKRCNNMSVLQQEDVAQHSYYCTLLAMTLADEYNTLCSPDAVDLNKIPLDISSVMRKALLHDTEETFTSDIIYTVKHVSAESYSILSTALEEKIDDLYQGSSSLFQNYKTLARNSKEDREGVIVAVADLLELGLYCYEEYQLGNPGLQSILINALKLMRELDGELQLYARSSTYKALYDALTFNDSITKNLLDIQ